MTPGLWITKPRSVIHEPSCRSPVIHNPPCLTEHSNPAITP
jgi:hypothetical protein